MTWRYLAVGELLQAGDVYGHEGGRLFEDGPIVPGWAFTIGNKEQTSLVPGDTVRTWLICYKPRRRVIDEPAHRKFSFA